MAEATLEDMAIILHMLFGDKALDPIESGGYMVFRDGKTKGILQQIDERLVRIEKQLGLEPISFVLGEEPPEGGA